LDRGPERLAPLDGLRGVAALVVFHITISTPRAGSIYMLQNREPLSTTEFPLNYSPLRVVWAGSEAVVVFYVLSGLVLSLPFIRGRGDPWGLFYPRRLARLYLPAIASLVFAWLTTLVVARHTVDGASPWLKRARAEADRLAADGPGLLRPLARLRVLERSRLS
jgi:peptidoglycan/LPS O-acetylase OafA/YrhL